MLWVWLPSPHSLKLFAQCCSLCKFRGRARMMVCCWWAVGGLLTYCCEFLSKCGLPSQAP
jgi:hypothetical protein